LDCWQPMKVRHYIKEIIKPAFSMMLLTYCLISSIAANANEYRLDVLAQLPALSSANNIAVIPLPVTSTDTPQYLLADDTGELSLLDDTQHHALSRLPLSNRTTNEHVKLTALTLHPSFAMSDKAGYQTFFTAHIEAKKTNNNVARLTLLNNPTPLPFDAVITQWKYDSNAENKVNTQQQREVIRIAVPTATHQIQKIAFNPYSKIWHDDYGLMHIALAEDTSKLSNVPEGALYSGAILRINPEKVGLRSYMVPSSNPFMKTSSINNEIFILGAQSIHSFSWSKQHFDALLVQHTYAGTQQVVVANKGADWRKSYQNKLVFKVNSKQALNKGIYPYYGRKLKTLVGSVLYLSNNTKNWQFVKLNTATTNSDDKRKPAGQVIRSFSNDELPTTNKVSLFFDHAGEPLLLDVTNKQLLSVSSKQLLADNNQNIQVKNAVNEPSETTDSGAYGKLLLTLLILIVAVLFYRLRPKNNTEKSKLRSQFARFELDDTKTTLSFYKRHQSKIDCQISISDIIKSEVLLNNANVNIINKDKDHGYNEQLENQLRLNFTQVHRHKLIDNEIREVQLYLTDLHAKTHIVCLYLRKGNQRLTKAKYFETLESLIDWNWFIAQQLNPQATDERKANIVVPIKSVNLHQKQKETPKVVHEKSVKKDSEQEGPTTEELHNIAIHDSELINALDKLADLKQKGFLTEEEFSLAKSKILSDITDNK